MREIKFRGKRKSWNPEYGQSEWMLGNLLNDKSIGEVGYGMDSYVYAEVIPETVGQFTGLSDKNGKEIFEGDIINIAEEDEDSAMGREIRHIGVVKYGANGRYVSDYQTSFILHCKEWYKEEGLLYNIRYQYEITGNIHDNPELLK